MTTRRALVQVSALLPALAAGWGRRGAAQVRAGAPLVFLGDRALPPYEFLDNGTPRGADVDLARAIGEVLGRPVEIRLLDWNDAQARLLAGEGDALLLFGRSASREGLFDFSAPTMPVNFSFFVRADHERDFVLRDRLPGLRIAVTRAGLPRELLASSHPEAELVLVGELPEAIEMLRRGAVDALAGVSWTVRHLLFEQGVTGLVELPPFARRTGSVAVREGERALLAEIDRALAALRANGTFDEILDRWSGTRVHLVPDWMVRTVAASGATAALALAGLGWLAVRLRGRTRALSREVEERRRAEAALAASQERLALASAAAGLGVWEVEPRHWIGRINPEFRALYGLGTGAAEISQAEWLAHLHPEDRARIRRALAAAFARGGTYREEYRILRADTGAVRWIASRGSVVASPEGGPGRLVGICYDVTERRLEQERQLLLAREVDHRARNVLAVVQSVVRLTRSEDPKDFAEAVEGRVAALARAHSLLSRDHWTGADLGELVREEFAAYPGGEAVDLAGPALRLEAAAVQPLSMVMHELATNAAKYGALSRPGGRVTVSWEVVPGPPGTDATARRLRIAWVERGGPDVEGVPGRRGFGSALIAATVRSQLMGSFSFDWAREGLRCAIDVPAAGVLAPLAPGPARPEPGAPAPARASPLYGRRVLVVEDEPLVAMALQEVLQDAGCTVRGPASTMDEARRLAEDNGLDAAVMDVNLPDGRSLPLAARLAGRGVPVVFVTGLGELPLEAVAGAAVLHKPVRDEVLLGALARAIAGTPASA